MIAPMWWLWDGVTSQPATVRFTFELNGPELVYLLNGPPLTYTASGPELASYTLIGPDTTEELNDSPFQSYELQ